MNERRKVKGDGREGIEKNVGYGGWDEGKVIKYKWNEKGS
jgi:hypothetical protein